MMGAENSYVSIEIKLQTGGRELRCSFSIRRNLLTGLGLALLKVAILLALKLKTQGS